MFSNAEYAHFLLTTSYALYNLVKYFRPYSRILWSDSYMSDGIIHGPRHSQELLAEPSLAES